MRRDVPLRLGLIAGAGAMLAAGAAVWGLGPGAAGLVERIGDGRAIGRLGRLQLEGVSGAWIGDLVVARAALADEAGIWIEARGVRLDWRPHMVLLGRVEAARIEADQLDLLRRPELAPPRPEASRIRHLVIDRLAVETITLAESVVGQAAEFSGAGAVRVRAGALQRIEAAFTRRDSDADRLDVNLSEVDGALVGQAAVFGAPGGVFAAAIGAPAGQGVAGRLDAEGDAETGAAAMVVRVGDGVLAQGRFSWSPQGWGFAGGLDPERAAALPFVDRLGGPANVRLQGAPLDRGGAVSGRIQAPALDLSAQGRLSRAAGIEGPVEIQARVLSPQTVLPEAPADFSGLTAEGAVVRERGAWRFAGQAAVEGLEFAGARGDFAGSVRARWSRSEWSVGVDAEGAVASGGLAGTRFRPERVALDLERAGQGLRIQRLTVVGEGFSVSGSGGDQSLDGDWRISDLRLLPGGVAGGAAGRWRLVTDPEGPRLAVSGVGDGVSAPGGLGQMLGSRPVGSAQGQLQPSGLALSHARLEGPGVRIGAAGRVGTVLDLRVEASLRPGSRLGPALFPQGADASGRVLGRASAPRLVGGAAAPRLEGFGAPMTDVSLSAGFADGLAEIRATAQRQAAPLTITAALVPVSGGVAARSFSAQHRGFEIAGDGEHRGGRTYGSLRFEGPLEALAAGWSGQTSGTARLTLGPTGERLDADIHVSGANSGAVSIATAHSRVSGPAQDAALTVLASGATGGQPFALSGEGAVGFEGPAVAMRLNAAGVLAGEAVATRSPARIAWTGEALEASLDASVGSGSAVVSVSRAGGGQALTFDVRDAPAAPIAAFFRERAEGVVTFAGVLGPNTSSGPSWLVGRLEGNVRGFRLRGRMRDRLDADLTAELASERLTLATTAKSADGLDAALELAVPVTTDARAFLIRQSAGQEGRLTWRVQGAADPLWALTGSLDQSLDGEVSGSGVARFGPGQLAGEGAIRLTGAAFEDRVSGVRLRDLAADIVFDDAGVRVSDVRARDPSGGQITGRGALTAARDGRLDLSLNRVRLVDREDISMTASGEAVLEWSPQGAAIRGALAIEDATVRPPQSQIAAIPMLDVIEINRPESVPQSAALSDQQRRLPPPRLDLRLTAPGRVFTRGRGVAAEWALNLRVTGTTRAVRAMGSADLVRGDVELAGAPFALTRGRIAFSGPPEEAILDIVAERAEADLTARIRLSGRVGAPTVGFESDPALPEDEVLPRVLFGQAAADLTAFQAAQLAASLSTLAGGAAFDFADLARQAIGLDRLDVRSDGTSVAVAGGRYLTRDVYLELGRTSRGLAESRLEWRVRPQLRINTSYSQSGEQRASLRWRRTR